MPKDKQRIIKKYSNRRLYDTEDSCYITQNKIREYVNSGIVFRVVSAKSGEDITRSVLLHVIFDEEIMGMPLFSEEALRSIILFSGSGMRGSFSSFLEQMLPLLQGNQFTDPGYLARLPGNNDRMREQYASLQNMMLGNSLQEYLNRIMHVMNEINHEFTKNTAKIIKPVSLVSQPKKRAKSKKSSTRRQRDSSS